MVRIINDDLHLPSSIGGKIRAQRDVPKVTQLSRTEPGPDLIFFIFSIPAEMSFCYSRLSQGATWGSADAQKQMWA